MNQQPLAKGFQQIRFDNDKPGYQGILEVLYAVLPNGAVLKSEECIKSNSFYEGREWSRVDAKPEGLEFIGNYRLPASLNALVA